MGKPIDKSKHFTVLADSGRLPLMLEITPNGVLRMREKRARVTYDLNLLTAYGMAVRNAKGRM